MSSLICGLIANLLWRFSLCWFMLLWQIVAIKWLNHEGIQGSQEFIMEVLLLSLLRHSNLVCLIGYCTDGDQRLLVYEYMPMGSLEDHLFGRFFAMIWERMQSFRSGVYATSVISILVTLACKENSKDKPSACFWLMKIISTYLKFRKQISWSKSNLSFHKRPHKHLWQKKNLIWVIKRSCLCFAESWVYKHGPYEIWYDCMLTHLEVSWSSAGSTTGMPDWIVIIEHRLAIWEYYFNQLFTYKFESLKKNNMQLMVMCMNICVESCILIYLIYMCKHRDLYTFFWMQICLVCQKCINVYLCRFVLSFICMHMYLCMYNGIFIWCIFNSKIIKMNWNQYGTIELSRLTPVGHVSLEFFLTYQTDMDGAQFIKLL